MTIKFYTDKAQRKQLLLDGRNRGENMLHDDFINKQGNATDGTSGKLTFEIVGNVPERVIKSNDELNLLLYKKEIRYDDLLDLLTIQALKLNATRWEKFRAAFGL